MRHIHSYVIKWTNQNLTRRLHAIKQKKWLANKNEKENENPKLDPTHVPSPTPQLILFIQKIQTRPYPSSSLAHPSPQNQSPLFKILTIKFFYNPNWFEKRTKPTKKLSRNHLQLSLEFTGKALVWRPLSSSPSHLLPLISFPYPFFPISHFIFLLSFPICSTK